MLQSFNMMTVNILGIAFQLLTHCLNVSLRSTSSFVYTIFSIPVQTCALQLVFATTYTYAKLWKYSERFDAGSDWESHLCFLFQST